MCGVLTLSVGTYRLKNNIENVKFILPTGMCIMNATGLGTCTLYQLQVMVYVVSTFCSVTRAPEQPQDLTVVEVSSRQIDLMWVEPHDNNAPITRYEVAYLEPEFVTGERERVENVTGSGRGSADIVEMATISGLFPGVSYTFTVTAVNEDGSSVPSDPLTVRTLEEGKSHIFMVLRSFMMKFVI